MELGGYITLRLWMAAKAVDLSAMGDVLLIALAGTVVGLESAQHIHSALRGGGRRTVLFSLAQYFFLPRENTRWGGEIKHWAECFLVLMWMRCFMLCLCRESTNAACRF